VAALAQVAQFAPWFDAAWEKNAGDAVSVIVAHQLLPHAQDAAAQEARRRQATGQARARMRDEACGQLRERVPDVLALVPAGDRDLPADGVARLLEAFDGLQAACLRVERLSTADAETAELRKNADKLAFAAIAAQRALARAEQVQGINAMFMAPQ